MRRSMPSLPALLPLALSGLLFATPALADWSLDPARSHLAFVSIKSNEVAEVNSFGAIAGTIDGAGQVAIRLQLDTVETLIPIRNERMREMLFDTANYKEAVLQAKVEPEILASMAVGEIRLVNAEGSLTLHGATQPMTLTVQAARVDANTIMVASAKPLIVDAEKFGLTDGVEKLREVAGLQSIAKAVPVSFVVTFVDAAASQ